MQETLSNSERAQIELGLVWWQLGVLLVMLLAANSGLAPAIGAEFPTGQIAFTTGQIAITTGQIAITTGPIVFPVSRAAEPVKKSSQEVRFQLTADVLFAFDKADLRPEAVGVLRDLAHQIKQAFPRSNVTVEGHTDAKGDDTYNQRLSERRAETVRAWLVKEGGISAASIKAVGYGKTRPVAENTNPDGSDNPEGRQKNRRVEVIVAKRS